MGSSQASTVTTMAPIQAWVEEVEQVINSQASFDTFQPAEVKEIVNRFRAVLETNLNCQEVSQMVRAVSLLLFVTGNLASTKDRLVELLHGLLSSFLFLKQKDLVTRELNEEVLDVVTQCVEGKEVKMIVLEGLAGQMLAVIANRNLEDWIRRSWLKTFNLLLSGSEYKLKEDIRMEYWEDLEQLVDYLYTCGDYDTQSSVVETLLRFTSKTDRPKLAMTWFPNYALVQSLFIRIKDFETDCRNFLNCFNEGLGNNQLVFPLPSLSCHVGEQQIYKPPDQKYRQFWVDFNLGPGSLSIYHVKEEGSTDLWDLLTITQDMVTSASTIRLAGSTVLTLSLSQSTLPISQAVLVFSPDPKLSQLLPQLFPQKAVTAPPHVPAVKAPKCSRATGKLLLPKSSCPQPPPAVTVVLQLTTADISSSSQASLPCGQTGKMSSAEVPVQVDTNARQAVSIKGKVEDNVEYLKPGMIIVEKEDTVDKENNNCIIPETPEEAVVEETFGQTIKDIGRRVNARDDGKVRVVHPVDEALMSVNIFKKCLVEKEGKTVDAEKGVKNKARSEADQKSSLNTKTEKQEVKGLTEKEAFEKTDKKYKDVRISNKKKVQKTSIFQAKKKAVLIVESNLAREDARERGEIKTTDNSVAIDADRSVAKEMEEVVEEGRDMIGQVKKADEQKAEIQPLVHLNQLMAVDGGMIDETPSKDCDFLPASPADRMTVSGERRRAKRKLSLTRRKDRDMTKDKRTKLSFSSPTTNIFTPSLPVAVINPASPPASAVQSSCHPKANSSSSPQSSSAPLAAVICPPATQTAINSVNQADKTCSTDLSVADTFSPIFKAIVTSPLTASICPPPPSPQVADDSFPPSSCDSLVGLAKLLTEKPKLSFPKQKERVSISPGLSQVGEVSQEDREMRKRDFQDHCETNKAYSIMISRSSSLKKRLMSTKYLLLEEEVSEISTEESGNHLLAEAPLFEEVYKRKKNHIKNHTQMKDKVTTKPPATSADQPDPASLPPLGVYRKSLNFTDQSRILNSTVKVSNQKFFKDDDSSTSMWTGSLVGGERKPRGGRGKPYTKSWPSGSSDGDTKVGQQVLTLYKKTRKSKQRRKTVSTSLASGKTKRSTRLFSDDEDEEDIIKPVESPLLNPIVSSISNKPAEQSLHKAGMRSKRSHSLSSTHYAETSCPPFMPGQMPPGSAEEQESFKKSFADGGDPGTGEVEDVLMWTMRVMEMVSRKGKTKPQLRQKWMEIRRIAAREEGRKKADM